MIGEFEGPRSGAESGPCVSRVLGDGARLGRD